MMPNQRSRILKLTREEVLDIQLALMIASNNISANSRWSNLYWKVVEQFEEQETESQE